MHLRFVLFSALSVLLAPPAFSDPPAPPVAAEGFTHVRTLGGISEYTLDQNGLQVLLLPDPSTPTVTFMITYRVGSRHEVTGTTGATHLLEHLMFKGTPAYNREKGNSVDQFLERVGAHFNATTWLDRTNYYATVGRDHLEGYLAIEADRMRNLWLREEDRRPEMTVVRNEFEMGENNPIQALDKEIVAAAYVAHPYHHSTIGWRSDIENVPIEKLRAFYDTFYWPDNSTVTLIGDFDPATALGLVRRYYGVHPRAPQPIAQPYTEEPEQTGPRRVVIKRAGELGVVGLAFKTPARRHADMPALQILDAILASGKGSRFYRALVDKSLATQVYASTGQFHDPHLLQIYVNLAPGVTHQDAENAVLAEIARVKTDGVTAAEVAAAINQTLADSAYRRDGSFAMASTLNEYIASGDWTLYVTFDDAIAQVTPADVQRVAQTYLLEDRSTTGWFVPTP
jgi:zinc protease